MSQMLSQVAVPVMRQEQRLALTPQLIQAMDILQLPLPALEARLSQEMEKNPFLEFEPETATDEAETEYAVPTESAEPREERPGPEAESFDRLEELSRAYDFDPGDLPYGGGRFDGDEDPKMEAMANSADRPISLQDYLLQQWAFLDLPDSIREAGELIINHLDEDGYLRIPLEELSLRTAPPTPVSDLQEALRHVQRLDPAGIGARDLQECLLLQLEALPGENELEKQIVRHHLRDLEKNRFPAIAKALGCELEEVKAAVEVIRRLSPRPGLLVVDRQVPRIVPDVIVDYAEDGDGYEVRLARGNWPRLRISPTYRRLLEDRHADRETREFLRKNFESASALIDAIRYRRERLLAVAREVVKRQHEFFEKGPAGLKVLRMSELAEKFGCDPSTISRTVAEKYIQTPRGIFPLRMFFTGGLETQDGEATSWNSIRARVKEIIDAEDKKNPLSDDEIARKLKAEGMNVSRRTVAKYRKILGIPSSHQRREY